MCLKDYKSGELNAPCESAQMGITVAVFRGGRPNIPCDVCFKSFS